MDINELFTIPLFDSIPPEKREVFLSGLDYTVSFLEKGELVARSGDLCKHLYLLMKGKVKTEMVDGSGAVLRIETIYAHRPLAPAFLFAENNRFPVTVTVLEDAEIVLISRDSVLTALLQYESFLKKFLLLNAECMKCLTDKLHLLACKTIRSRLIFYLLDKAKKGTSSFVMKETQQELADYFGVTRPALAKVLYELMEEGLIRQEKRQIFITDKQTLRREIM